jgi:hypothetical protein
MKARVAGSHNLVDSVRGVNKVLFSDATTAETTYTDNLTSFNVGGFSVGASASSNVNINGNTYVGWQWNAGGATVTNGTGTISSQVRANTTAGFSVVTYTGTGANATVGHGLGVAPGLILTKQRSAAQSWYVYHSATGGTKTLYLNLTDAAGVDNRIWNNTDPTTSVFSIGTVGPNASGVTQVAYCWAPVAGYSAFGSYTGNGSTDGPFIYTGFRPRWVMIKNASTIGYAWLVYDTSINTYNAAGTNLRPNTSGAEGTQTSNLLDFVSNGIKIRGDSSGSINSVDTYIYAAFAENPLKYANAR